MTKNFNDQDQCVKIVLDKKTYRDCLIYMVSTTYEMSISNCMNANDTITLTKRDLATTNSVKKIYIKELISSKMRIYNTYNLEQFLKMLKWIAVDYIKDADKYYECSYILYNVNTHNFYYIDSNSDCIDDTNFPTIEKMIKKESDRIIMTRGYTIKKVNEFNERLNDNLKLNTLKELTQYITIADINQPKKRG